MLKKVEVLQSSVGKVVLYLGNGCLHWNVGNNGYMYDPGFDNAKVYFSDRYEYNNINHKLYLYAKNNCGIVKNMQFLKSKKKAIKINTIDVEQIFYVHGGIFYPVYIQ